MLAEAITAKLPVVLLRTKDTMHVDVLLSYMADGVAFVRLSDQDLEHINAHKGVPFAQDYFLCKWREDLQVEDLYAKFEKAEKTLIILNPDEDCAIGFDAGYVSPPADLILFFLQEEFGIEDSAVADCLAGLELKTVYDLCKIAQATGPITVHRLLGLRRQSQPAIQGMDQIDTDYPFYSPDPLLKSFLEAEGQFFLDKGTPKQLRARGALLYGQEGTGKTMGAKYLARKLEVPLYHISLATMMDKYQGESQTRLRQALAALENSGPCVALIDEAEKVVNLTDSTGTGPQMLAILLWWMQEHSSQVFTVLTSNDLDNLPKEVYRPGRISIKIETMPPLDLKAFVKDAVLQVQQDLKGKYKVATSVVYAEVMERLGLTQGPTQARIIEVINQEVKKYILQTSKT